MSNRTVPDFGFYTKGLHKRPEVRFGKAKPYPSVCRWCAERDVRQKMARMVTGAVICPRCDLA